jgi:hypothetical protein
MQADCNKRTLQVNIVVGTRHGPNANMSMLPACGARNWSRLGTSSLQHLHAVMHDFPLLKLVPVRKVDALVPKVGAVSRVHQMVRVTAHGTVAAHVRQDANLVCLETESETMNTILGNQPERVKPLTGGTANRTPFDTWGASLAIAASRQA